jgi:eukaryotic-like serine/threonine-protein kinase
VSRESTTSFAPGGVLAGKFRVERELGRGAMGVVLLVTDQILGRKAALKILEPMLASDDTARARLLREAGVASRLTGRHVARVLEAGTFNDGAPYVAFEHLEGETLEAVVDRHERLPVSVAVGFVLEALEGLQEAHKLGLVHRDLKPANLFLARMPDGPAIVKVLDFGLARADDSARLTATGDTLGSPAYMAPEQLRAGETAGPAADVWALGVTLFELLTGELPFAGDSVPAIAHKILRAEPTALASLRDDVPSHIERVIARCLEKAPADRFADASEMRAALRAASPHDPSALAFRTTESLPRPGEGKRTPKHGAPRTTRARSSATLFALGVLGTVIAGAALAFGLRARVRPPLAPPTERSAVPILSASPDRRDAEAAAVAAATAATADTPGTLASTPPPPASNAAARQRSTTNLRATAREEPIGRCLCKGRNAHGERTLCHAKYVSARTCLCELSESHWLCVDTLEPCNRMYPRNGVVGAPCVGYSPYDSRRDAAPTEPRRGVTECDACIASRRFAPPSDRPCVGFDEDGVPRRGVVQCD